MRNDPHASWVTLNAAAARTSHQPLLGTGTAGRVRYQINVGSAMPHFASPSLSGGYALVGTMSGVVAVSGA